MDERRYSTFRVHHRRFILPYIYSFTRTLIDTCRWGKYMDCRIVFARASCRATWTHHIPPRICCEYGIPDIYWKSGEFPFYSNFFPCTKFVRAYSGTSLEFLDSVSMFKILKAGLEVRGTCTNCTSILNCSWPDPVKLSHGGCCCLDHDNNSVVELPLWWTMTPKYLKLFTFRSLGYLLHRCPWQKNTQNVNLNNCPKTLSVRCYYSASHTIFQLR